MKILQRRLLAVACSLLAVARVEAVAPWPMANGNYFEGFGSIATWTNNFASPTEATRWGSVAVNGTGTIPDGRRTTEATSAFTTSNTGGVQRGASNLVQLSTGSTDNTSANAVDLHLDFTGRAPGTLAFDWTAVANDTGNRASSLRVYTTTNGVNFAELTNAAVLNLSNNVAASGSITNILLPAGFSNCATARIRFYEYNGTGGSTGRRAKIAIDNVSVTHAVSPTAITLPATGVSGGAATLNGTVHPGGAATTVWFEWGLSPFTNSNVTAPVTVGSSTNAVAVSSPLFSLTPGLIYHARLVASNAAGLARSGGIAFGSPAFPMFGAPAITNECLAAYHDPGLSAFGAPLAIAAGFVHSLVLKMDGTVVAWGFNGFNETTVPEGLSNVVAIAGGEYASLAIRRDGTVAAWGSYFNGQITIPEGLSNVVAVTTRSYHTLALKGGGTISAWGRNDYGQSTVPADLDNVVAMAAGNAHSLVLKNDGTMHAWGYNQHSETNIPAGLDDIVAIAAGNDHNLVLQRDGTVVAWGYNVHGQTNVPVGLSNVVSVAAGNDHSLALRNDGTVAAWGRNSEGQTTVPAGLSNVVAIAAGGYHNLALKINGAVVAWGYNVNGQADIPAGLSTLPVMVGGTFHTNNTPGFYTRTYSASNSLGGTATATRTIIVRDTTPPVLMLLGGNPVTNRLDVPFVDPGATALDACAGSLTVTTNSSVNVAVPGTYSVVYAATDNSGRSTSVTRTVVVGVLPVATTLPVTGASNTVATLNGTVNPGGAPTTAWFEWGLLPFSNTNLTTPVMVGGGTNVVAVSNLLSGLAPGPIHHARLVVSNAVGIVRGVEVTFGMPLITLNGATTITNECQATFTDPATATGTPLAIAAGAFHSLGLRMDGTAAAWGRNSSGQTVVPTGLSNLVAIAAGYAYSLALKSDGTVVAWGSAPSVPAGLSNVLAVAAGFYHSLALKRDGTLVAWGDNNSFQTFIPAGVSNVVAVAAGYAHNLVLKRDGTVAAWGYNCCGQTTIPASVSNVVAIAAGFYHNLALKRDGTVVAWGDNASFETVIPSGLSNVVAIAAGDAHSLALRSDGTVVAWGHNFYGQTTIPVGLSDVVAIAGGSGHTLALKRDGTVIAWGLNAFGQTTIPAGLNALPVTVGGTFHTNNAPGVYTRTYSASNSLGGIATATRTIVVQDATLPVITLLGSNPLSNRVDVPFVDPGATVNDACDGSLTVTTNSTVNGAVLGTYAVSYSATDSSGNSVTNTRTVVISPVPPVVATLPVMGASNTVARLHGTIIPGSFPVTVWFEWGLNGVNNTNFTAPVAVDAGLSVVAVSDPLSGLTPGFTYRARLVASNALGIVSGLDVLFGTPVLTLNGAATVTNECHASFADAGAFAPGAVLALAGGGYHSLALRSDGTVAAWGAGTNNSQSFPNSGQTIVPAGLSNVIAVAAGERHSLALKSNGTVAVWGSNANGQTNTPAGLSNVVAIAAGSTHSLALKNDGTVAAWGRTGRQGPVTAPAGLSNVIAIAGGFFHSLALKSDGTISAWGENFYGQTIIPMDLSNVVSIAAGVFHSLALKSNGTVAAWGYNAYGQTTIPAGLSNVVAIAAGGSNSLALKSDGTVVAWGSNTNTPAGLSNVADIAVGGYHSLALKNDGTVAAWGNNAYGQTTIPIGLSTPAMIVGDAFNTSGPPGTYTLTYLSSNSLGGLATVTRTIVVQDTTPPVITLLGGNPLTLLANTPFLDLGATALDTCDGSYAVMTNNPVNVAVPGTYTVSYIASDSLGHSATNTRIVNVIAAPPQVISPVRLGNGTFQFGFTNQPGAGFTVWASTNVALPFAQWSNLGAPVESPAGTFLFTDSQATNGAQRFYRVSSP